MSRRSRYAPDNLPRPWHWTDDAACSGEETALFFPVGAGGIAPSVESAYPKQFCRRCPVRSACLTHALTAREDHGVWGGLDEEERTALLRDARRAADRQRRREREKANATSAV